MKWKFVFHQFYPYVAKCQVKGIYGNLHACPGDHITPMVYLALCHKWIKMMKCKFLLNKIDNIQLVSAKLTTFRDVKTSTKIKQF